MMHKLSKDGAVKAVRINTILRGRKQFIQESLHAYVTTSLLGWLINSRSVFNKINLSTCAGCFSSPSSIYHKQIKSIQIQ